MPSITEALEFSEATEKYSPLAQELVAFRKSAPYAEYETKLLELDAARERCEKARRALKDLKIKRRQNSS